MISGGDLCQRVSPAPATRTERVGLGIVDELLIELCRMQVIGGLSKSECIAGYVLRWFRLQIEATFFYISGIYLLGTVVLLAVPLSTSHYAFENGDSDNQAQI